MVSFIGDQINAADACWIRLIPNAQMVCLSAFRCITDSRADRCSISSILSNLSCREWGRERWLRDTGSRRQQSQPPSHGHMETDVALRKIIIRGRCPIQAPNRDCRRDPRQLTFKRTPRPLACAHGDSLAGRRAAWVGVDQVTSPWPKGGDVFSQP
jgi:hypothetical protein